MCPRGASPLRQPPKKYHAAALPRHLSRGEGRGMGSHEWQGGDSPTFCSSKVVPTLASISLADFMPREEKSVGVFANYDEKRKEEVSKAKEGGRENKDHLRFNSDHFPAFHLLMGICQPCVCFPAWYRVCLPPHKLMKISRLCLLHLKVPYCSRQRESRSESNLFSWTRYRGRRGQTHTNVGGGGREGKSGANSGGFFWNKKENCKKEPRIMRARGYQWETGSIKSPPPYP